ncbi:MAG: carboxyltransferase domain-containing protein [Micropruina sp.]|uniref:5-oxoprolinase subunit B family protein n=1 Tax=Micropruina sp. TaxID=2737536 RepID=UPI0039E5258D
MPGPASSHPVQVLDCGDSAVRVVIGEADRELGWRLAHGIAALLRQVPPAGLLGVLPTYDSVLVEFDCTVADHAAIRAAVTDCAERADGVPTRTPRTFTVPVAYGGEHGPDLDAVAALLEVTPEQVIARHTAEPLLIRCFGSPAGAPMMDGPAFGAPIPRLASPRPRVPAGAVAVAGRQAVVSACPAPGGWRVLGSTPLRLVDPSREPLAPYLPGDSLRFVPIAASDFEAHRGVLS